MPAVVPVPNLSSGVPVGLPGEAYQPMGAYGLPGEGYLGQGFFPTAPSTTPAPAETPVNMPTKRTVYEGPRAHQVAKQRWEKQQIRKWLGSQAAQRPTAPTPSAPSAPVNPNAGVPTPSVSSGYAPSSPTTGARVFVGGSSGPPTVLQNIPSPRGASTGPPTPGSPLTGPRFGPSAPIKSSMKVGPTNPSPFPQMRAVGPRAFSGGTQLNPSNLRPTGWGGYVSRGMNALAPLGTGQMISGLGDQFDSDTLRAAGTGTSIFGTAAALGGAGALPATAVPAAGIGLGGALARPSTTRTAELGRFLESRNFDDLNFAEGDNLLEQGADAALDLSFAPLSGLLAGGSKALTSLFGGDTSDPNDNPALRGERGMDSLGLGFGGEGEGESSAPRQILPAELPDVMSSLGVSQEIQQTALSQMDQDIALYRVYAERGMPIPGDVDADGKPVVRDPSEIEGLVTARFLQSLPELVDMEREQQSALARAAMFQATMGDMMAPYQDASNALADSYGPMLTGIEGVAPELQGPLADYAAALAAQTRGNAAAYGAMGMAVPATVGLEQYMARQEAMQNRLAAMQMQAEIDAMSGQQSADATEADILG